MVRAERSGTHHWALRFRDLALLCVAVATGRRRGSVLHIRVADVNVTRKEIRYDWEKGKPGRVVPVAAWAMEVIAAYIREARPLLRYGRGSPWLFVSERSARFQKDGFKKLVREIHAATVDAHPDLRELPGKRLTPHSLRVTFAKLLFQGGCNIRTINELMNHTYLSSTAYYVPIRVNEIRQAFKRAHPRA